MEQHHYRDEIIKAIYSGDYKAFASLITVCRHDKREFIASLNTFFPDIASDAIFIFAYGDPVFDVNEVYSLNDPYRDCYAFTEYYDVRRKTILHEVIDAFGVFRWDLRPSDSRLNNTCYEHMIKELLTVPGIDVNIQDSVGWSPLILAREAAKLNARPSDIVEYLLQYRATDINVVDQGGWTFLIHCADDADKSSIELILKYKSASLDFNARCIEGINALEHAMEYGSGDVIELLAPYYPE